MDLSESISSAHGVRHCGPPGAPIGRGKRFPTEGLLPALGREHSGVSRGSPPPSTTPQTRERQQAFQLQRFAKKWLLNNAL